LCSTVRRHSPVRSLKRDRYDQPFGLQLLARPPLHGLHCAPMLATDRKLPLSGGQEKRSYVRAMFTAIAPRYDFLNHLLSLNIDRRWRRQAVNRLGWESAPEGTYLDLCAGTLDLAAELGQRAGFRGRVFGADFVLPMLALGRGKSPRVRPVNADALELPFPDATFDGATVGFGVRNFAELDLGLA